MTYPEFLDFACHRPEPDTPGFYKLEWFSHVPDAAYTPKEVEGGYIWSYRENPISDKGNYEYYPTFAEAYNAMLQKTGTPGIYGFTILKLGYGPLGTKDFYINFRSYDAIGEEYLRSVCSSYHYNQPGPAGKFLGRDEATAHFKPGDIVQIDCYERDSMWIRPTLGVIVERPLPVTHYWESYRQDHEELGKEDSDRQWFEAPSLTGSDEDEYFIQTGPYDPELHNFTFRNAIELHLPALPVPTPIRDLLLSYYQTYQTSSDSL